MKVLFIMALYWWVWLIPLGLFGGIRLLLNFTAIQ